MYAHWYSFNLFLADGTILFNACKIPAAFAAGILQALKSIVPSGLKGLTDQ